MRTPKAKSAEPSARSASDCACPVSAKKHTAPAIARSDPSTKVTLGRSIVVRPVYHKLSFGNHHLPAQVLSHVRAWLSVHHFPLCNPEVQTTVKIVSYDPLQKNRGSGACVGNRRVSGAQIRLPAISCR